jgi:hypothetical protein
MMYLQMEPLFDLCLCGVVRPSRGDCTPLGWILVRLVGCKSLEASLRNGSLSSLRWTQCLPCGLSICSSILTQVVNVSGEKGDH